MSVRICTIGAYLYLLPILFFVFRITRAIDKRIHGTITEKAVNLLQSLMAGIVFTICVLKKSMTVFHFFTPERIHNLIRK